MVVMFIFFSFSSTLEQKDCNLSHIEVNEMFGFVGDIGTKISANNTMPSGIIFLVKLFFNKCLYKSFQKLIINYSNIFFNVEFLQSLIGTINSILLHFFRHVCILHNCFPISLSHILNIFFNYFIEFRFSYSLISSIHKKKFKEIINLFARKWKKILSDHYGRF